MVDRWRELKSWRSGITLRTIQTSGIDRMGPSRGPTGNEEVSKRAKSCVQRLESSGRITLQERHKSRMPGRNVRSSELHVLRN